MIAVGLLALAGASYAVTTGDEDEPQLFCTTEGIGGPPPHFDTYGRSSDHGCQFVKNATGELMRFTSDGEPVCYDETVQIVRCSAPGAQPPG